jgi:ABC-type multidrug transport system ATPase subunit
VIQIELNNLGKRFSREWILRGLTTSIAKNEKLVITGANGSGKSTLLQIIAGYVLPTEGELKWKLQNGNVINHDSIYKYVSIASPMLELIEEFTPIEIINHQNEFKKFQGNFTANDLLEIALLNQHKNKTIKHFSSGMKQRLKLLLAVVADAPLLLLDEPIINLDKTGVDWYKNLISNYATNKTIIVCSNKIKDEYDYCTREISIDEYKYS